MVKITEIYKSIVNRLKSKYPDISFNSQRNIKEGFDRPSFFVDLDNRINEDFMRNSRNINITVRIYYFSTTIDNNQIELYTVEDDLVELFLDNNLIEVNEDIKFEIDDIEILEVDKVLHCYFDIKISQNYIKNYDDKEFIEDINLDLEINE